jgi:chemotaxis signal transduction protein
LAFSPDGQYLASASADRTIAIWDPRTGLRRFRLARHEAPVHCVAFHPNSRQLVSTGADHTVRLWGPLPDRQEKKPGPERASGSTTGAATVQAPVPRSPDTELIQSETLVQPVHSLPEDWWSALGSIAGKGTKHLLFSVGGDRCAFAADHVVEVVRFQTMTPATSDLACLLGTICVRGADLPVFDVRRLLGKERGGRHPSGHVIVVRGAEASRGLFVDRVHAIRPMDLPFQERPSAPSALDKYARGVVRCCGGNLTVLDVDILLRDCLIRPGSHASA